MADHTFGVQSRALSEAIATTGLAGRAVVIHSSLKSFGHVEGGVGTVVHAFLDRGCTVVVPTFTYECQVDAPPGVHLRRNAADPPPTRDVQDRIGFSASGDYVSHEMGAIPAWVAGTKGRRRGDHPLNSFSALGPEADSIIRGQSPSDVYAPLRAVAEQGGAVALMGVDLTSMTLIHLAEQNAGRELFVRWARRDTGSAVPARTGSCSRGFEKLGPVLSPAESVLGVGPSRWRVFEAADVVRLATSEIARNPQITVCDDSACQRCAAMAAGGPIGTAELFASGASDGVAP